MAYNRHDLIGRYLRSLFWPHGVRCIWWCPPWHRPEAILKEIAKRPHWSSGRCWCDDFHRDQATTLPLVPPAMIPADMLEQAGELGRDLLHLADELAAELADRGGRIDSVAFCLEHNVALVTLEAPDGTRLELGLRPALDPPCPTLGSGHTAPR